MDLSVVYSKTGKGLRARSSMIGGLSSHLMRVLSLVDGKSKAETILLKYDELSEEALATALTQLESQGYVRAAVITRPEADWAPTVNFTPMIVEEIPSVEEAEAKAKQDARLEAERIRAEELAKEKAKAEAKVKAHLEEERIVREAEAARKKAEMDALSKAEAKARIEAERKAKAEEEVRLKAERKAKAEEEARLQAERKAKLAQEAQTRAKAEAEAKEYARREIERISRVAEEEQRKAEFEARTKAENEARIEAERKAKVAEEARLQAETEAKEKLEAEEHARLEAEHSAREAEEKRKKAEAEASAKAEEARLKAERKSKAEEEAAKEKAERKAREEAAARAKLEAEEKAHFEMASIVRKAEEDRKKAGAKAKEAKQEAKRKAKAEEEVRIKAKRKGELDDGQAFNNVESEEKTSAEAKEKVRLEKERFASAEEEARKKAEAEFHAKAEAEHKAQAEAEHMHAKVEAEEKANAEAKEKARLEMERIAREAEEVRQKHDAENHLKVVARTWSQEELQAREEAEEEAFLEEERIKEETEKTALKAKEKNQQETEEHGREEIKHAAIVEAEALAKLQGKRPVINLDIAKGVSILIRAVLIYLPLSVLMLIGLMPFFNLSTLIAPIEKLASESVGEPVTITEVHASLWPEPHLELGNIAIGANAIQKIEAINILPEISSLSENIKRVDSLELVGLKINQENFAQPLQWVNNLGKAEHLKIWHLGLKKMSLKLRDLDLGIFDGKIGLTESHTLSNIELNSVDDKLTMQIVPQGGSFDVMLTANKWPLPVSPKIMFDELNAKGTLNQGRIDFSQINGEIYGGKITAKALVDWSNQWTGSGNFNLINVTSPQLLKAFGSGASIDGKLNLTGNFTSISSEASKLGDIPDVTANFELRDGKINGVDLQRAVLFRADKSLAGDATHFDKLSGSLQFKDGQYQYRQLVLEAEQFHAKGNMDIQPKGDISGKINADLVAKSRRLYANFSLEGTVGDVKRQ